MVEEVERLEHHAHLLAQFGHVGFWGHDVLALHDDFTAVGLFQEVQTTQKGTLAGTRRTDNGDYFAFVDGYVYVVEYGEVTIFLDQVFDFYH